MPTFLCRNCKYQQHQCFACGRLGFSDKSSSTEVFPCVSATCGHFYHPKCVAKLLHPHNKEMRAELCEKIAAGESFACPVHKCIVCKKGEDRKVDDLRFALCRRCPKAYHKKCLPSGIYFETKNDRDILQRAWNGLLPNRILIYCLDHEIQRELGTPFRDHLKFPDAEGEKEQQKTGEPSSKEKVVASRRIMVSHNSTIQGHRKFLKQVYKGSNSVKISDSAEKIKKRCVQQQFDALNKQNTTEPVGKPLKEKIQSVTYRSSTEVKRKSSIDLVKDPLKSKWQKLASGKIRKRFLEKSVMTKENSSEFVLTADMEKRIRAVMIDSTASFSEDEVIRRQKVQGTDAYHSDLWTEKITEGKVECSVNAI